MENFNLIEITEKKMDARKLSFIGDCVWDLLIRSYIINKSVDPRNLHGKTVKFVNANFQEKVYFKVVDSLNEEESDICKNARNKKVNSKPKSASLITYKHATAFEALVGHWYITGQKENIVNLLDIVKDLEKEIEVKK